MAKQTDEIGSASSDGPGSGKEVLETPSIDDLIRNTYSSNPNIAKISALAESIGKPRWWVSRRAGELGLTKPRLAAEPWSKAECAVVDRMGDAGINAIASGLRAAGFSRTMSSIAMELKRQARSRTPRDVWSARTLAEYMGVDSKTVAKWIAVDALPAQQDHHSWKIQRADFKDWLAGHRTCFDLRKVDQEWFLELLFD